MARLLASPLLIATPSMQCSPGTVEPWWRHCQGECSPRSFLVPRSYSRHGRSGPSLLKLISPCLIAFCSSSFLSLSFSYPAAESYRSCCCPRVYPSCLHWQALFLPSIWISTSPKLIRMCRTCCLASVVGTVTTDPLELRRGQPRPASLIHQPLLQRPPAPTG